MQGKQGKSQDCHFGSAKSSAIYSALRFALRCCSTPKPYDILDKKKDIKGENW